MCKFVYFDGSGKKFSNAQSLATVQARDRKESEKASSLQPRDRHNSDRKIQIFWIYIPPTFIPINLHEKIK